MLIGNATWGDFVCNSDAEMLVDGANAVVGTTCLRTDVGALPGTLYVLQALPNNVLYNWQPVVSGGAITSKTAVSKLPIAVFGDSLALSGDITDTTSTAQEIITAPIPATGTTTRNYQASRYQTNLYYPACYTVAQAGVGGETTQQMLDRDAAAYSASRKSIFDVADTGARVCIMHGAGINDIAGFTAATPQATVDAVAYRHIQTIVRGASCGMFILDVGLYGINAVAGNTADIAAKRAAVVRCNALVKSACASMPNVRFLETSGLTHDGTGALFANASNDATDGVHLGGGFQALVAKAQAAMLTDWFGPSVPNAYVGANLLGIGAMYPTTASQSYGTTPANGYLWNIGAGTRQNANVYDSGGKRWSSCECVPSAASPYLEYVIPFNLAAGTVPIASGGIYGFECDAFIESLDGQELGVGAYWLARLWAYEATNTGKLAITHSYNAFNRYPDKRNDMHLILPPWQADRVGTAMGSSSNLRIQFGGRTDGSQAFRAGVSTPRFVRIA